MKQFDVQADITYKTWVRVSADNEVAAKKRVEDMAWDITAVQYQIFHALAIILVGIISKSFLVNLDIIAYIFICGIILFSGSLYLISIYKISILGVITPIGGTLYIVGWLLLLYKLSNI